MCFMTKENKLLILYFVLNTLGRKFIKNQMLHSNTEALKLNHTLPCGVEKLLSK